MGKARYIYFDDEINEKLESIPNRSKLICDLLKDHFRRIELDDLSDEELQIELAKAKAKAEYEAKLEDLKNGKYRRD